MQLLANQLQFFQLDDLKIIEQVRHGKSGRPSKTQQPTEYHYHIEADLIPNSQTIAQEKQKAGRFILASNVLDYDQLSNSELLIEYKAQQSTERGFRFLKDPLFFTSSVFLKSPKRITAKRNGYGFIAFGLQFGSTSFTFSFGSGSRNYFQSIRSTHRFSYFALGFSILYVGSSHNCCWSSTD